MESTRTAPENQPANEQKESLGDSRRLPGGAHGTAADPGMTGVNREGMPSKAERPGQQDFGSAPESAVS